MQSAAVYKKYDESFLYQMNVKEYNKILVGFVLQSIRINLNDKISEDIIYNLKKRCKDMSLINFIMNEDKIKLLIADREMPKSLKVVPMKDIRDKNDNICIFIDCTNIIKMSETGNYECDKIDNLIAYLYTAKCIYDYTYKNNYKLSSDKFTVKMYVKLFTNIIDALYKISITPNKKNEMYYVVSKFYMLNVLNLTYDSFKEYIDKMCKSISDVPNTDIDKLNYQYTLEDYSSIDKFIRKTSKVFSLKGLEISNFIEKWIFMYGPSMLLGIELFPVLALNIISAFNGIYDNNQRLIEKLVGDEMVAFNKEL